MSLKTKLLSALLIAVLIVCSGSDITPSTYKTVQSAGVDLPKRTVLNLGGAGVVCADNPSGNRTDCSVSTVTEPGVIPNTLISGGGVVWTGGLTFTVSAARYTIGSVQYSSPQTDISLAAADPLLDRIDVIAVDSTASVVVIIGTPAATPAKPDVDPATQLELTFAYLPAAAVQPINVTTSYDIYHENVEWTTAKVGAGIDLASPNNPHSGVVDIEATGVTTGNYAQFTNGVTIDLATQTNLAFYLRSKAAWPSTRSLQLTWFNGATRRGTIVVLSEGAFNFTSGNTASYQQIVVPVSLFQINGILVNRLRITVAGSGAAIGWYLDDIILQTGLTPPFNPNAMTWKGAWNASASYARNDTVSSGGTSYVAVVPNTNSTPTAVNPDWAQMVAPSVPTIVTQLVYRAALCAGGSGSIGLTIPAAGYPIAACIVGANSLYGVAQFLDTETDSFQDHFTLPEDWTGNVDFRLYWRANVADVGRSAVWQLQTACVAAGETGDSAWNPVQAIVSAASAVAYQWRLATQLAVTTTGCASAEELLFRVLRDPTHGSDNLAATAEAISLRWTVRHN